MNYLMTHTKHLENTIDVRALNFFNNMQKQQIVDIAKEVRGMIGENSKNQCDVASDLISNRLEIANIPHQITSGWFNFEGHTWIEFGYGDVILDITADQFGNYPKIWLPADEFHYEIM